MTMWPIVNSIKRSCLRSYLLASHYCCETQWHLLYSVFTGNVKIAMSWGAGSAVSKRLRV